MKKVLSVFGTRPEAIKMAPIIKEIEKNKNLINIICVTAQHREMLDQVLDLFNIIPNYDLNIMKENQSLSEILKNIIISLEDIIKKERPDIILVHGDTSTTLAASLVGFYQKVKVGHIEAGLRTYNKYSPFPEEINRQLTSVIADLHFAPTETSKYNLIKEGKDIKSIFVTGNTAIDALRYTIDSSYTSDYDKWIGNSKTILLTAHRRENLDGGLSNIFDAINIIAKKYSDIKVIYPVHLNPFIKNLAKNKLSNSDNIKLINPLNVREFHNLMSKSYIIMTDSGGIQEEAPSLNIPVLVLRDTTERPEGLKAGTLILTGTKTEDIVNIFSEVFEDKIFYKKIADSINPYGDGYASIRIVEIIEKELLREED